MEIVAAAGSKRRRRMVSRMRIPRKDGDGRETEGQEKDRGEGGEQDMGLCGATELGTVTLLAPQTGEVD